MCRTMHWHTGGAPWRVEAISRSHGSIASMTMSAPSLYWLRNSIGGWQVDCPMAGTRLSPS
jgi:hypothetical protein